jgi:hypothetical protein
MRYGPEDPKPPDSYRNVMDPEHWLLLRLEKKIKVKLICYYAKTEFSTSEIEWNKDVVNSKIVFVVS